MDSTRNIIDAGAIAKMKDGVVLINVSRGELVDTDALIDAVESKKVGALPWTSSRMRAASTMRTT